MKDVKNLVRGGTIEAQQECFNHIAHLQVILRVSFPLRDLIGNRTWPLARVTWDALADSFSPLRRARRAT